MLGYSPDSCLARIKWIDKCSAWSEQVFLDSLVIECGINASNEILVSFSFTGSCTNHTTSSYLFPKSFYISPDGTSFYETESEIWADLALKNS